MNSSSGLEVQPRDGRKRSVDERADWVEPMDEVLKSAPAAAAGDESGAGHKGAEHQSAAKRARGAGGPGGAEADAEDKALHRVTLSDKVAATVQRWKGHTMVHVREYYLERGEVKFGSKGLALRPHEFIKLVPQMSSLLNAYSARQNMRVPLSDKRAAEVGFRPHTQPWKRFGFRLYEHDGRGNIMKGIELTKQEVALLTNAGEELCAAAGLQPPPPPPVVAAPARSLEVVELGNKKHASVSRAEGALVVRLEARGAEEKGISLSPSDRATVAASVPAVSEALGRRDVAFSVQLSGSRRVTISDWNGATYVQVREFYEKYGKQLPGNKGLGMNPTEWAALAAAVERLSGALARAQGTV